MATIGYREEIHSARLANLRETLSEPGAIAELRLSQRERQSWTIASIQGHTFRVG